MSLTKEKKIQIPIKGINCSFQKFQLTMTEGPVLSRKLIHVIGYHRF